MNNSDGGKSEPKKNTGGDSPGYIKNLMLRVMSSDRRAKNDDSVDRNTVVSPTFVAIKPALDPEMIPAIAPVSNSNPILDEENTTTAANKPFSSLINVPRPIEKSGRNQNAESAAYPDKDLSFHNPIDVDKTPALKDNNRNKGTSPDILGVNKATPENIKPAQSAGRSSQEKDSLVSVIPLIPQDFGSQISEKQVRIPLASLDGRVLAIENKMHAQRTSNSNSYIKKSTNVTIHIGRIEIRALNSAKGHSSAPLRLGAREADGASRSQGTMSLREYLKKRARGGY
jgi:hypothetical protein